MHDHTVFDSLTRAQLLDDSFNLGRAEHISQEIFLELASYLINEEDPLPFQSALNGLSYIYEMLYQNKNDLELIKVFIY